MSAKVIVFDGPDGVGKSTQLALAKEALESQGFKVHTSRTPGGTPFGEELRKVFLSSTERPPETDLHVVWGINLAIGKDIKQKSSDFDYILIDRGPLAFLAYQVYGSGLDTSFGIAAAKEIMQNWQPDLSLFFSAPVEITHQRLVKDGKKLDYFESMGPEFHKRVLKGYEEAAKLFKPTVIDSKEDIKTIHAKVMQVIFP